MVKGPLSPSISNVHMVGLITIWARLITGLTMGPQSVIHVWASASILSAWETLIRPFLYRQADNHLEDGVGGDLEDDLDDDPGEPAAPRVTGDQAEHHRLELLVLLLLHRLHRLGRGHLGQWGGGHQRCLAVGPPADPAFHLQQVTETLKTRSSGRALATRCSPWISPLYYVALKSSKLFNDKSSISLSPELTLFESHRGVTQHSLSHQSSFWHYVTAMLKIQIGSAQVRQGQEEFPHRREPFWRTDLRWRCLDILVCPVSSIAVTTGIL